MLSGTIKVEGNIEFYYEDSGTDGLDLSDYSTVVLIHGMGFNGAIFRKMFPYGPSHNYRLVSLYRRGYAPSSPWTEGEVSLYKSSNAADGKKHLRLAGLQIARFLLEFATSQGIPKHNEARKTGGIHLIGWSLGTMFLQAVLANLDGLAAEELDLLEGYLRTFLHLEPVPIMFGLQPPKHLSPDGIWDFTQTDQERWEYFNKYVRGFYAHKDHLFSDAADIDFGEFRTDKPLSLDELTKEELEKITSFEMFLTHDLGSVSMPSEALASTSRRAFFDAGMAKYLPKAKIRFMCATESAGDFIYIMHELGRCLKVGPSALFGEDAEKARDFQVTYLERGNHFMFWDEPRWALEQFRACIEG